MIEDGVYERRDVPAVFDATSAAGKTGTRCHLYVNAGAVRRVLRSYGGHPVVPFSRRWTVRTTTHSTKMRLFADLRDVDVVFIEGKSMGPGDQFGMARHAGHLDGPFLAGGFGAGDGAIFVRKV